MKTVLHQSHTHVWLPTQAGEFRTAAWGQKFCRQLAPKQQRLQQALADLDQWDQYCWRLEAHYLFRVPAHFEVTCRADGLLSVGFLEQNGDSWNKAGNRFTDLRFTEPGTDGEARWRNCIRPQGH